MRQNVIDEEDIKRYLLGELDEEKQQLLEKHLLTDEKFFEQLLIVEDELVDEYLRGKLSAHERQQFVAHFLSTPERHQKLRFARALGKYITTATAEKPRAQADHVQPPITRRPSLLAFWRARKPIMGFSLAVALLLILFGSSWWIIKVSSPQHQPDKVRTQQSDPPAQDQSSPPQLAEQRPRKDQSNEELKPEQNQRANLEKELASARNQNGTKPRSAAKPQRSQPVLFVGTLMPGLVRETGEMKRVVIPSGTSAIRLRLALMTEDYRSYQAVLQTAEGREISSSNKLKAKTTSGGKVVDLILPAKLLTPGDYQLKLSGLSMSGNLEDIGSYPFRVLHK